MADQKLTREELIAKKEKEILESRKAVHDGQERVREDFELQYNEHHEVVKVKVGETDLVKLVNSNKNNVGLINAWKQAIARGEDPLAIYGKTTPGIPVAIDPNTTMDELIDTMAVYNAKYESLAKELGCSVQELKDAVANGTLESLIKIPEAPKTTEGGE